MELIDRDALLREIEKYRHEDDWKSQLFLHVINSITAIIKRLPTVDVEPVRHGKWIERWTGDEWIVFCANCNTEANEMSDYGLKYHYCPNCGAKMSCMRDKD